LNRLFLEERFDGDEVLGESGGRMRTLGPAELTWLAAVPCALVIVAAIVLLAPPLGRALFSPGSESLWPPEAAYIFGRAEPVKQGRYLMALLGPALVAAAVLVGGRRRLALRPNTARALLLASQIAVLAFVVVAVVAEHRRAAREGWPPVVGTPTIVIAAALAIAFLIAARHTSLVRRVTALARETPAKRIGCVAIAIAATVPWLLTAVDTEGTIRLAQAFGLMAWSFDDPFAILNGRTPLVDYHAMYAQLVPYGTAAVMRVFGTTVTVYTVTLTFFSGLTLLAVYAVFRRLAGSALLALMLYLPFMAMGFLYLVGPPGSNLRLTNAQVFSVWPMRYGGGYLLAWLTLRNVDGAAPRRAWVLFLVAGLVAINNLEFGLGALAATSVALACARPPRSWRGAARSAAEPALGLLGAVLLVVLATLVHAGELPEFGLLLEFPRLFSSVGLVSQPMPALGLHMAVYVTFAAAIAVAVTRTASRSRDSALTSMLAWSGVFGLIAGSYFVGRADAFKLTALLSAWSLSIALLTIAVVRALAARAWRPRLPELAVLLGFAIALCALVETPAPWRQVERLGRTTEPVLQERAAIRFVDAYTRPREHVALVLPIGHRVAYELGITNVSPYAFIEPISTRRQFQQVIDDMRRTHAHKIFMPQDATPPRQFAALAEQGFRRQARTTHYTVWSDAQ